MVAEKKSSFQSMWIILGNQLFPLEHVQSLMQQNQLSRDDTLFYMAEDLGLCTYVKHHQQKLVLFLTAMRHHADKLKRSEFNVHYTSLEDQSAKFSKQSYEAKLTLCLKNHPALKTIHLFEIEDQFFERRLVAWAQKQQLAIVWHQSPMFMTTRSQFKAYIEDLKSSASKRNRPSDMIRPFMAKFYERQRKRLDLLMVEGKPAGGQWSFDSDNRKKVPANLPIPLTNDLPEISQRQHSDKHLATVIKIVGKRFSDHPGSASEFWWPVSREESLAWLDQFLLERFRDFGPYEDALNTRDPVLFHSALSPMMNMGLLTPDEVIERTLVYARKHDVPLNSLEGFIRQIVGWREFVRGIDRHFNKRQAESNYWEHEREMASCWWDGTTGLLPLDEAIQKTLQLGWSHHIERLMVLANLMNLCEIRPRAVYDWFMSMYVDSSDWVMGPNVYGMGLMSDGGIFATKPYICGSNYILKMSNYRKGAWCDVMDGLYWRFVDRHQDFFAGNPRMSMMVRSLGKLKPERRALIFDLAEAFIERVTQ